MFQIEQAHYICERFHTSLDAQNYHKSIQDQNDKNKIEAISDKVDNHRHQDGKNLARTGKCSQFRIR